MIFGLLGRLGQRVLLGFVLLLLLLLLLWRRLLRLIRLWGQPKDPGLLNLQRLRLPKLVLLLNLLLKGFELLQRLERLRLREGKRQRRLSRQDWEGHQLLRRVETKELRRASGLQGGDCLWCLEERWELQTAK
jgi:hypothetical protein